MPPMPPPGGMPPPPPALFFGSSATMASVVISKAATDAAFWIAARTTLVGSLMPFLPGAPCAAVARGGGSRPGQRLADGLDAGLLVVVLGLDAPELFGSAQQGDAAA